jgi:ABC-type amino acid transport substrate-binding protein
MGTPVPGVAPQVGILVLDADAPSAGALRVILDSEGWRVRIVPDAQLLLTELKSGEWSLVVANIALTPPEQRRVHHPSRTRRRFARRRRPYARPLSDP